MKYRLQLDINLPRKRTIELLDSWENLYHWMDGLQSHEHISGEKGKTGAETKMIFLVRGREMEMIEKITRIEFPEFFDADYVMPNAISKAKNRFEIAGENQTRWIQENDFQCSGFMKIMMFLMPGAFRRQSLKYMENFKKFAEARG